MKQGTNDHQYQLSKAAIQGGSKSFRLASLFLDSQSQKGAYLLYRWCRHCDDQIDQASDSKMAKLALDRLYEETSRALGGEELPATSPFAGLSSLSQQFQIPHQYFYELLEGFDRDVAGTEVSDLEDLLKYCYHVAGVVGLMMSHILGAHDPKALKHADNLGRAMQLTNICRDIGEDFRLQRIYLPRTWLKADGLDPAELMSEKQSTGVYHLVLRLLSLADELYDDGRKGLCYLPFRAAWSISIASYLYQGIGLRVRALGPQALKKRTVLSPLQKLKYVLMGTLQFGHLRIKNGLQKYFKRSIEI